MPDYPQVQVESRAELRAWLSQNHTSSRGIWLVTFKKHCGARYVSWPEIVAEVLCFGWIDSRSGRIDEDRTSVILTPRRPGSRWSAINKRLVAELEAQGLMQPAGRAKVEAARKDGSWTWLDEIEARVVPPDLAAALDDAEGARAGWEQATPGSQKYALTWLKEAKRAATREKRLAQVVARCAQGQPPR